MSFLLLNSSLLPISNFKKVQKLEPNEIVLTHSILLQLIELENKLRAEMKSRNKAEKRMNLLMKKLGSLNISFASDESEQSFEKSEVSSVSSTASSYTKQQEDKKSNTQIANSRKCDIGELMKNTESPIVPESSDQTS